MSCRPEMVQRAVAQGPPSGAGEGQGTPGKRGSERGLTCLGDVWHSEESLGQRAPKDRGGLGALWCWALSNLPADVGSGVPGKAVAKTPLCLGYLRNSWMGKNLSLVLERF